MPDGFDLHLEAPPQRVVPVSATAVDIAAALLEPARIAGVPEQAFEYSTLHSLHDRGAEAALWDRVPRFDAYLAEPVLQLVPDLVLADPWGSKDTSERLRAAGVPLCTLPEVKSWADARAALELAARVFGAEDRAAAKIADLEQRVARLRERPGRRRGLRAVTYSNFGSAGWTAGLSTTIHEEMTLAGITNAVAVSGREGHVQITFEELIVLDPDLILVSKPLKMPAGTAGDRGGASEALLTNEPSLRSMRAVREKRIVSLPAWLFATSSHELVTAAETLAREVDALLERTDGAAAGGGH
jgi:iron complex transport system substrate-binding protein